MSSDIFSVKVFGCTEVVGDCPLRNVAVRVSLASVKTGELVEKHDKSSSTFSQHEKSDVVPQACTHGVCCAEISALAAVWNETFVFNEPVGTLLDDEVCLFFEIIDLTIHPKRHCFNSIAWAFLRVHQENLGKVNVLRLFSYPSKFNATVQGVNLPVVQLMENRKPLNAKLTVKVERAEAKEVEEVGKRPESPFQREVADKGVDELLDSEEMEEEEDIDDSDMDTDIIPMRQCVIPRRLAAQIPAGENGVLAMRFNRKGTYLAVALQMDGGYWIQFYDCRSMNLVDAIKAHVDLIYELAFSTNDRNLLSVSSDGMAKVWSAESPRVEKMTLAHPSYVYTGKFHPTKDQYVATAGVDGIVRIWDRKTGKTVKELTDHRTRVNSVVFSPNGRQLFSGDAQGCIGVWDFDLDEHGVEAVSLLRMVKENEIKDCCITHMSMGKSNLSLLVYTHDGIVRNFETKVMVPSQRYVGAKCSKYKMEAGFSPDSSFVYAGSESGSVMLWSVKGSDQIPVIQWNMKFSNPVTSVVWNHAEDMVAFSSFGPGQNVLVFVTDANPRSPKRRRTARQSQRTTQQISIDDQTTQQQEPEQF